MSTQIKKTNNYVVLGKYELDMVLDIHAHTALTGLFVYGNSYDDVYRSRKQRILWKYLILHFILNPWLSMLSLSVHVLLHTIIR